MSIYLSKRIVSVIVNESLKVRNVGLGRARLIEPEWHIQVSSLKRILVEMGFGIIDIREIVD